MLIIIHFQENGDSSRIITNSIDINSSPKESSTSSKNNGVLDLLESASDIFNKSSNEYNITSSIISPQNINNNISINICFIQEKSYLLR